MQPTTLFVLACLVAVVAASNYEAPAEQQQQQQEVYESVYDTPAHERSSRTKRGLLLLKKKLLLGALGLKVAKVGAVGAGVVGAVALKKSKDQATRTKTYIDIQSRPSKYVEVHNWSG